MNIDKKSIIPLYYQLADYLRDKITSRAILPGDLVPSEFELMNQFDISRGTVRQAIQQLELEGLVERFPGRGTFVPTPKIEQNASKQMGFFTSSMRKAGKIPTAHVLETGEITAPRDVTDKLNLQNEDKVIAIRRLLCADGQPLTIEKSYFRHDVGSKLLNEDLTGSIYALIQEKFNYTIYKSKNSIEATLSDKESSELLEVPQGFALFKVKRFMFFSENEPIEYTIDLMRGDRFQFAVTDYYQDEKAEFRIRSEVK